MICFTVPGEPAGKGRARAARRKRKGGAEYIAQITPEKTARYENLVALAARHAMGGHAPFAGPVRLTIAAVFTIPASWSDKRRRAAEGAPVTKKPDASNVAKAIEDGMNAIVFADDSQIVELLATKRYGFTPGVAVTVEELS